MTETSDCPLTNDAELRVAANELTSPLKDGFPKGISQPALRALARAGYTHIDQLTAAREKDLLALHGMGPKAMGILKSALQARGKTFHS
jgi:hypothetical protein